MKQSRSVRILVLAALLQLTRATDSQSATSEPVASTSPASRRLTLDIIDEPVFALCDMLRFARDVRVDRAPKGWGAALDSVREKLLAIPLPPDDVVDACDSYAWYYRETPYALWPLDRKFDGDPPGELYIKVRDSLQKLAKATDFDVWWRREEKSRQALADSLRKGAADFESISRMTDYLRMPPPRFVIRATLYRERYRSAWNAGSNRNGDAHFIEVAEGGNPDEIPETLRHEIGHSHVGPLIPQDLNQYQELWIFLLSHAALWENGLNL